MKKKLYTTPAFSVDAIEMTEVICTSVVRGVDSGETGIGYGGKSSNDSGSGARANNRGIWDED